MGYVVSQVYGDLRRAALRLFGVNDLSRPSLVCGPAGPASARLQTQPAGMRWAFAMPGSPGEADPIPEQARGVNSSVRRRSTGNTAALNSFRLSTLPVPLFEIASDESLTPFRRLGGGAELYESELESLLSSDIDDLTESLFRVTQRPTVAQAAGRTCWRLISMLMWSH